ncbi:MAG: hypothetical protein AAF922_17420 [Pseudomonadota bacterium]
MAPPFGPTGGHRLVAASTGNETPEREVFVDVLARGCVGRTVQTVLHLAIRFKSYQSLMFGWHQVQVPFCYGQIPGIERICQDAVRLLMRDMAMTRLWKLRLLL